MGLARVDDAHYADDVTAVAVAIHPSIPPSLPPSLHPLNLVEEVKELAAQRKELEAREKTVRETGREVGLSLDEGRAVLGRERSKLKEDVDQVGKVCGMLQKEPQYVRVAGNW